MKLHYLLITSILLVASSTSAASRPTSSTSCSSWNNLMMHPTAFIAGCGVVGAAWQVKNLWNAHKEPVNSSAQLVLEAIKAIPIINKHLYFHHTDTKTITAILQGSTIVVGVSDYWNRFKSDPIEGFEIVHVFPKDEQVVALKAAQAAIHDAIQIGKKQQESERLKKLNKVQKTGYIMQGAAIGITCGLAGLQVWSMLPHRPQIAEHFGIRLVDLKGYKFALPYITLWKK